MSNVTEVSALFDAPEMKYPEWKRADFPEIGHERRHPATLPRIDGIGHDADHPDGPFFMFHVAGDEWIRTIHADEIDDAFIEALDPIAAFSLGKIIAENKPQDTATASTVQP